MAKARKKQPQGKSKAGTNKVVCSIALDPKLKDSLLDTAKAEDRTVSATAARAIREYVDRAKQPVAKSK